jgi:hypothetical protein
MTRQAGSVNLPAMPLKDPLMAQIAALLAETGGQDDPARIERTLTDGYARALALEAEHRRLSQRIQKMTVADGLAAAVQELERQEDEIGALRQEIGRLQRRHSSAVRATA